LFAESLCSSERSRQEAQNIEKRAVAGIQGKKRQPAALSASRSVNTRGGKGDNAEKKSKQKAKEKEKEIKEEKGSSTKEKHKGKAKRKSK